MAASVFHLDHPWSLPSAQVLAALQTSPAGLSSDEAAQRLRSIGPNVLKEHPHRTGWLLFLGQFQNPLVLILLFAAVVSAFAGAWIDMLVILIIVIGSAIITFVQEYSASTAVAQLRQRLTLTVRAQRDGVPTSIPAASIVPGDIVLLSAGSLIPADGVLLEANDLFVSQAVLTGETFPAEKGCALAPADAALAGRTNCVFMGTTVRSGTGQALVVTTGAATAYGQIAGQLNLRPPETEFQRGIRQFGLMLSHVMVSLVLIVFTVNVFSAKPPIDALLFAIALAVGISPELLPAIISINLARGAHSMASHGVIVRRLEAIENLGSMDVLCTDKTGTLTAGVVGLERAAAPDGTPSAAVLRAAALNAALQTGLVNALDEAILAASPPDLAGIEKRDEIPYDFVRKRLSIVVREGQRPALLITKGALHSVLGICSMVQEGTHAVALDDVARAQLLQRFTDWSAQGFRVLGLAIKELADQERFTRADERDMTFAGFLLFFDPPKPGVQETIEALSRLGVRLKIITGDNQQVTEHVAALVGLPVESVLTGTELNSLRDEALWHAVGHTDLFVEVDPNQKERIIRTLQRTGHVVGYMGDGINDAPALHSADVSISVEGAVDVAREAADFVLLESGLEILRSGVEQGRRTFGNSLKYVFTTTSANFGNMVSMAGASAFLPFLPLLAKQILLNNFLSDIPAIAIADDSVDQEWVERPHRWDVHLMRRFMITFGLVSSIFDYLTFGLLAWVLHAVPEVFRTAWFIESLLTELVVALIVRTQRPFYRSRPGRWLLRSSLGVSALTLVIPWLPLSGMLGFVPISLGLLVTLVAITLLYALVTEVIKQRFYHHERAVVRPQPG